MNTRALDAQRLSVKLYFDSGTEIDLGQLIPIFHRWIRERALDELLIDVADYRHVPDGPGVMLIAHEAHYSAEAIDGRLGLRYARQRPAGGGFTDRLRGAVARALRAARALEREPALAGLAIPGDRWSLAVEDRLLAPNEGPAFAAVEPELKKVVRDLYPGTDVELRREDDPGQALGIEVAARSRPGVATLLERLSTAPLPVAV